MFFGFNSDRSKRNVETPLPITDGGTGAATVGDARENLDVYSTDEIDAKINDSDWFTPYSDTTNNYAGQPIPTYLKYRKINNIVYVLVKGNRQELTNYQTLTLPVGYRPPYDVCETVAICDNSEPGEPVQGINRFRIGANGVLSIEGNLDSSTILEGTFIYPVA